VTVQVDPVLEIQNIEDQSADRHDVVVAGRDRFETLLGFGPEAAIIFSLPSRSGVAMLVGAVCSEVI
jgi:hypothetical protein